VSDAFSSPRTKKGVKAFISAFSGQAGKVVIVKKRDFRDQFYFHYEADVPPDLVPVGSRD
jgi:hypothetical protein